MSIPGNSAIGFCAYAHAARDRQVRTQMVGEELSGGPRLFSMRTRSIERPLSHSDAVSTLMRLLLLR